MVLTNQKTNLRSITEMKRGTPKSSPKLGHDFRALFREITYFTRGYRFLYPRQWVPNGFMEENLGFKEESYYISIKE